MWGKLKEAFHDDEDDKKGYQHNYGNPTPAATNYNASPSYQSRLASMSLHSNDCIRFLNLPQHVIDRCRQVVQREWASNEGINREREYGGSWEFDLHGSPWGSNSKEDATAVRRMLCGLLRTMHSEGWMLALSTDISRKNYDKDMVILRNHGAPQGEYDWGCVSFSSSEKLRFIDCEYSVAVVIT